MTMPALTATDFEMKWDADHTFQFVESEDATIIAYGHRDPEAFAALVKQFDVLCGSPTDEPPHSPDEIKHVWATSSIGDNDAAEWEVTWADVTAETPGAFPLTVILR